jgi:hypothetical protein
LLALGRLDEAVGQEAQAAEHYRQAALGFAHLMADAAPLINAAGRPQRREQLL